MGVGACVINEHREILMVMEKNGPLKGKNVWKVPTGVRVRVCVSVCVSVCVCATPHLQVAVSNLVIDIGGDSQVNGCDR